MEDASMVLVTLRYPSNPGALLVQGDALYHTGLFEHSLVSYYKVGKLPQEDIPTALLLLKSRRAGSPIS